MLKLKKKSYILVILYTIFNNHDGEQRKFLDHQQLTLIWAYHLY